MLTKQDYMNALQILGFVREDASRTDGSHIRFHHPEFPNLYCGITDHKNTKEMSRQVYKDLAKTMATYIWLKTIDKDCKVDFKLAKEMLKRVDEELVTAIIKLLKKADGKDVVCIIPQRLHEEVDKVYDNVTLQEITSYIQ